jgi:hypothetical protein
VLTLVYPPKRERVREREREREKENQFKFESLNNKAQQN